MIVVPFSAFMGGGSTSEYEVRVAELPSLFSFSLRMSAFSLLQTLVLFPTGESSPWQVGLQSMSQPILSITGEGGPLCTQKAEKLQRLRSPQGSERERTEDSPHRPQSGLFRRPSEFYKPPKTKEKLLCTKGRRNQTKPTTALLDL